MKIRAIALALFLVVCSSTGCASLLDMAGNKARGYAQAREVEANQKYGLRADDHALHKLATVVEHTLAKRAKIQAEGDELQRKASERVKDLELAAAVAKSEVVRDQALALAAKFKKEAAAAAKNTTDQITATEEEGNRDLMMMLAMKGLLGLLWWLDRSKQKNAKNEAVGLGQAFQELFVHQSKALKQYMMGEGPNDLMGLLKTHRPKAHAELAKSELVKHDLLLDRRLAVNGHGKSPKT